MNMIDKRNLHSEDFVHIIYNNNTYDLARVVKFDRDADSAELEVVKSSNRKAASGSFIVDTSDKWAMICPVSVEGEVLRLLGFKPASENVAGTTSVKWIKNDFGKTWTLEHNSHGSWKLTLDMVQHGESQPLREKFDIGWIWQIQRCISNPNIMNLANK